MADALEFDRSVPVAGEAVEVAEGVVRLIAPNPGPFTQSGTCSYIVGSGPLVIIDPGPEIAAHRDGLLRLIDGREVSAILLTHTHKDHSPLAAGLSQVMGVPVMSGGPHVPARLPRDGETAMLDASADMLHRPDRRLVDGELLRVGDLTFEVIATPGHTMNHLCFALANQRLLFSGDHVMGWSTSIVAPPDGSMRAYMASLRKLIAKGDAFERYLPGHGEPVRNPLALSRSMLGHRMQREASIMARLRQGDRTTAEIVAATYQGLDKSLILPAQLSVFAQLEALIEEGRVTPEGEASLFGRFALV